MPFGLSLPPAGNWLQSRLVPTIDVVNFVAVVQGLKKPQVVDPSPTLRAHILMVSTLSLPPFLCIMASGFVVGVCGRDKENHLLLSPGSGFLDQTSEARVALL